MIKRDPCDFDHSLPGEWAATLSPMAKPSRWRKRAGEIRALAEQVRDHWTKDALLRLAAGYDQQAETAEKRVQRSEFDSCSEVALLQLAGRHAPSTPPRFSAPAPAGRLCFPFPFHLDQGCDFVCCCRLSVIDRRENARSRLKGHCGVANGS